MADPSSRDGLAERLRDLLGSDPVRVLLSVAILVSVLPFPAVERLALGFFALFALEATARGVVLLRDLRLRQISQLEWAFFALDLLATASFLPLESLWQDASVLRLLRLSRLLLLLGYWGPLFQELRLVLEKRERRYQLAFVVVSVAILSFSAALLLHHFHRLPFDFDQDGVMGEEGFWALLWWALRQVESPDNLLTEPSLSLAFACSVVLTLLGLVLFSFLVGIGASVVEELVALSRERPLGLRRHTVLCNVGPHSGLLLRELVTYYRKSLRSPRLVAMGTAPERYEYMHEPSLRRVRYREGRAILNHDLRRVDADLATRVILLGDPGRPGSDAEIVSQVLSVRQVNERCTLSAEVVHPSSIPALLRAGGPHTVPLPAQRFVSWYVAGAIVHPGLEEACEELLSTRGDEIYSCVYGVAAMRDVALPSGSLPAPRDLCAWALARHRVILLGVLLVDAGETSGFRHRFFCGMDLTAPLGTAVEKGICGFFGVCESFEVLRRCLRALAREGCTAAPAAPAAPRFAPAPDERPPRRILICGFHAGVENAVEELARAAPSEEIALLVPEHCPVERVAEAFLDRSRRHPERDFAFVRGSGPDELRFGPREAPRGLIALCAADWSDGRRFLGPDWRQGGLEGVDLVLLSWTQDDDDPDARSSLALLALLRLREQRPDGPAARCRIVCEVRDDEKAELFRARFGGPGSGLSVVGSEAMRSSFLAQGVFVPGLFPIYRELLGVGGATLRRLLPEPGWRDPLTFADLHAALLAEGQILVGLEIEQCGARALQLNPDPRGPLARFTVDELRAAITVGEGPGVR